MIKSRKIIFQASRSSGNVSGLLLLPDNPKALYVFAHGAGAPMNHAFMNKLADLLSEENIGTLRFNFPYAEKNSKRIDPAPVLTETVRSAVNTAREYVRDIPLFAGGKSMGGRMTSQAAAVNPLEGIKGIVFFGFPLHAPGNESTVRADHLFNVKMPMLFLQGSRDKLANLDLLRPIITKLGRDASLHVIEGADHSFHLLKSYGRSDEEVYKEMVKKFGEWIKSINKT